MQHEQLRRQHHSARVAVRAKRQDNQFAEIAIISLAGLTLVLIEMAHHAGNTMLPQVFGL